MTDRTARQRCLDALDSIRWTGLGFDTKVGVVRTMARELLTSFGEIDTHDPDVVDASLAVLAAFSDLGSLARNRRVGEEGDEESHNPTEFFHQYLRSLDVDAEGLPATFQSALQRAFAHYGVDGLEPTIELQRAAFRAFNAQQEAESHEPLVAAVLNGLRLDVGLLDGEQAARLRATLDALIEATELRFPNLGTQARNLHYDLYARAVLRPGGLRSSLP